MAEAVVCEICRKIGAVLEKRSNGGNEQYSCPRCGGYTLTELAKGSVPKPAVAAELYLLSGLCRHEFEAGHEPVLIHERWLTKQDCFDSEVKSRVPTGIRGKALAIL